MDGKFEHYQLEHIANDLLEFISSLASYLPDNLPGFAASISEKNHGYDRYFYLKVRAKLFSNTPSYDDVFSLLFELPIGSKKIDPDRESIMENLSAFFRGWLSIPNVNPACGYNYAIKWAARHGYQAIVEFLLEHYSESDFPEGMKEAVYSAATANNLALVKVLTEKGEIEPDIIDCCIKSTQNTEIMLHFLKDDIKLIQKYYKYFSEMTNLYDTINNRLGNSSNKFFDSKHCVYAQAVTTMKRKLEEIEKAAGSYFHLQPNAEFKI
ncbi:MAG: hypothetical protein H0U70_07230 [Tatlockia sp.]|nr:hypothetical protein [Tatlockia sp.]MBA3978639.1 hypothetical protein [Nitrosopumilus sp.]